MFPRGKSDSSAPVHSTSKKSGERDRTGRDPRDEQSGEQNSECDQNDRPFFFDTEEPRDERARPPARARERNRDQNDEKYFFESREIFRMFRPSFREYFLENALEPGGIFLRESGDSGEEKNEQNRDENIAGDGEKKGGGQRHLADRECPRQCTAELENRGHREKKGRDFGRKHCGNFSKKTRQKFAPKT